MEDLMTIVLQSVATVLIALVGVLTKEAVKYLKEKGVIAQISQHKELAGLAVQMTEQVYKDFDGDMKKEKAIKAFQKALEQKGISLSLTDIELFIESAVKEMNDTASAELYA